MSRESRRYGPIIIFCLVLALFLFVYGLTLRN